MNDARRERLRREMKNDHILYYFITLYYYCDRITTVSSGRLLARAIDVQLYEKQNVPRRTSVTYIKGRGWRENQTDLDAH